MTPIRVTASAAEERNPTGLDPALDSGDLLLEQRDAGADVGIGVDRQATHLCGEAREPRLRHTRARTIAALSEPDRDDRIWRELPRLPRASADGRRTRKPRPRHCAQCPFAVSGRFDPWARRRSRSTSTRSYNSSASTRRSSPPRCTPRRPAITAALSARSNRHAASRSATRASERTRATAGIRRVFRTGTTSLPRGARTHFERTTPLAIEAWARSRIARPPPPSASGSPPRDFTRCVRTPPVAGRVGGRALLSAGFTAGVGRCSRPSRGRRGRPISSRFCRRCR